MSREDFYNAMTKEERLAYNKSIINNKLTDEEKEILLNNIKLTTHIVKKFGITNEMLSKFYVGIEWDDLIQEATIGMVKGIKTFKFDYYTQDGKQHPGLASYIRVCAKNEALMYLRNNGKHSNVYGLSFNSDCCMNEKDGSTQSVGELLEVDGMESFDVFEIAKRNIDIAITERIIENVKNRIANSRYNKNTKDIMLFMFNKITDDTEFFMSITDLCKLYNNSYNTNYVKSYFNRIFNHRLKPIVAEACVEEDDSLEYDVLMDPKRKRYSY